MSAANKDTKKREKLDKAPTEAPKDTSLANQKNPDKCESFELPDDHEDGAILETQAKVEIVKEKSKEIIDPISEEASDKKIQNNDLQPSNTKDVQNDQKFSEYTPMSNQPSTIENQPSIPQTSEVPQIPEDSDQTDGMPKAPNTAP